MLICFLFQLSPAINVKAKVNGHIQGKPLAASIKAYVNIPKPSPRKRNQHILLPAILSDSKRMQNRKPSQLAHGQPISKQQSLPKLVHQTIVINKTIHVHTHPKKSIKTSSGSRHHSKQQQKQPPVEHYQHMNKNIQTPGQASSAQHGGAVSNGHGSYYLNNRNGGQPKSQRHGYGYGSSLLDRLIGNHLKYKNQGNPSGLANGVNSGHIGHQNTGLPSNNLHGFKTGQSGHKNTGLPSSNQYDFNTGQNGHHNIGLPSNNLHGFNEGHSGNQYPGVPSYQLHDLNAGHNGHQNTWLPSNELHGFNSGYSGHQNTGLPSNERHGFNTGRSGHQNIGMPSNNVHGFDSTVLSNNGGYHSGQGQGHGRVPVSEQNHVQSSVPSHILDAILLGRQGENHVNSQNHGLKSGLHHGFDVIVLDSQGRNYLVRGKAHGEAPVSKRNHGNQKTGESSSLPHGLDALVLNSLARIHQGQDQIHASGTLLDQLLAAKVIKNLLNTVPNMRHGSKGQMGENQNNFLQSGLNHDSINTHTSNSVKNLTQISNSYPTNKQNNDTMSKIWNDVNSNGLNHNSNNTHVPDPVNNRIQNTHPTNHQNNETMPNILHVLKNVVTNIQRNIHNSEVNPASNTQNSQVIDPNNPHIKHILIHGVRPILISSISGGLINNSTNPSSFGNALTEEQLELTEV